MTPMLQKALAIVGATTALSMACVAPVFADSFENEASTNSITIYRLYNPNTGEHLYTANDVEKDSLTMFFSWKDEGIGWYAPKTSNTPVYRLSNPNTGDHHFTPNAKERNHLIQSGWKDEGIGWYSDDAKTVPMYREYNPNAKVGTHNYTCNPKEHQSLIQIGWKDEQIAWYALESGKPVEKGHYEKVWVEGKTEKVPIVEEKFVWVCGRCGWKTPGPGMREHAFEHAFKGEFEKASFQSRYEDVIVGYKTVETPGHYEWKWVAD